MDTFDERDYTVVVVVVAAVVDDLSASPSERNMNDANDTRT